MGSTPARGVDISPLKTEDVHQRNVMSSSPPPMEGGNSPSKMGRSSQAPALSSAQKENGLAASVDGNTKLESNGNGNENGNGNGNGNGSGKHGISVLPSGPTKAEDSDDDGPGFDLARGFAPIGAKAQAQRVD